MAICVIVFSRITSVLAKFVYCTQFEQIQFRCLEDLFYSF